MKREKALETIKDFPTEFEVEELIEKLIFIDKVEKGLNQVKEGKTVSHEEAVRRLRKW